MNKTKIEYLDWTWNPIAMRCTPISEGCRNCWHLAMAKRLAKNHTIPCSERTAYSGQLMPTQPLFVLRERELEAPLHLRKPARIGCQLMGDLFHKDVPEEWRGKILILARSLSQHKFFFLTKRPKEMQVTLWAWDMKGDTSGINCNHLWFGVSIEDQKTADERIPILLQIPAIHRWVSVEPMLSNLNLCSCSSHLPGTLGHLPGCWLRSLDWVACGGETGPGARPLHPDWVRSLRDQCQVAGVPFFFKGWGEFSPYWEFGDSRLPPRKVGKKYSGHFLDGKEFREFPES